VREKKTEKEKEPKTSLQIIRRTFLERKKERKKEKMSSATKALEKLAQKKRRENEMKKIQKEREEAAKKSSCCGGGHMREGKEIDSDYNSSGEEVELRDEDSSDDDDDDDDENQGAIKVGRKRVSLGSKKDKLIFGIKPLPFFFLCLFMFVPVFTFLDKFFKFSQPSGPNAYSHIRTPKQQEWYMKIKAYYEDVNPAKLGEVPRLLAKYKGREEKLYKALRKKYEKNYDPHKTREEF
jgi:hypothetical protein